MLFCKLVMGCQVSKIIEEGVISLVSYLITLFKVLFEEPHIDFYHLCFNLENFPLIGIC